MYIHTVRRMYGAAVLESTGPVVDDGQHWRESSGMTAMPSWTNWSRITNEPASVSQSRLTDPCWEAAVQLLRNASRKDGRIVNRICLFDR